MTRARPCLVDVWCWARSPQAKTTLSAQWPNARFAARAPYAATRTVRIGALLFGKPPLALELGLGFGGGNGALPVAQPDPQDHHTPCFANVQ